MADEACQSLGGHLVSFQEGLENAMVAETVQQQRTGSPYWIGLNKLNGNAWSYTDDSQVSFTNWQDGPPARCQSGWTYFAQTNSCYKVILN
ncbi:lectin C-type domain protein [Teladorsagia circumcincta]|uniref:Lectin C-type domain protein n=1 Tax=Teladorsagia circumcincta TaxID=45464 RepID=A0A2G9TLN7_TELCI|nr:lectin C-type domain protein [Teladorsagia circumcincta]